MFTVISFIIASIWGAFEITTFVVELTKYLVHRNEIKAQHEKTLKQFSEWCYTENERKQDAHIFDELVREENFSF